MKNKIYLYLSFKNLLRNKKITYKNIFMLTLTLTLFIITTSIGNSLNKFIKDIILESPEYRSIMVIENENSNKNTILNVLNTNKNIVDFYQYEMPLAGNVKSPLNLFDSTKQNTVLLTSGFESSMPPIINGHLFDSDDKNVGIIPKNFDSTGQIGINLEKEKINYLDGDDFLGKTITLEIKDPNNTQKILFEYSFKVVGVYDSVRNMNYPDDIYIPYNELKSLRSKYAELSNEDLTNYPIIFAALSDDYTSIPSILKDFKSNDIEAFKKSEIGFLAPLSKIILYVGGIISIIIFFAALSSITLSNINTLKKRQGEIGMLKSFGYTDSQIKNIIFLELGIINIIGFICSIIISYTALIILNIFVKSKLSIYFSSLYFNIDMLSILGGIVLIFMCIIISSLKSIRYTTRINPIDAIKNKY
ncbi:MAG: FtsX-like permease family protein [Romboutsia timonensis]|uniref:ABC transporter permease n=1 Tax=Romboutsia timonensis TaxID=1776391 RepID=UPI002A74F3F5|nr:FtsX-like permease family protein [Romboutsia timonensis]MDY3000270.1 FtsX-like permease family protein [Romboutsia timonensis]